MSGISCHVLDTALGRPAAGVVVRLERLDGPDVSPAGVTKSWRVLGEAHTNEDGRALALSGANVIASGQHRITFETAAYFRRTNQALFYPQIQVLFSVAAPSDKYHIPLLLSPFGYSTYRGS